MKNEQFRLKLKIFYIQWILVFIRQFQVRIFQFSWKFLLCCFFNENECCSLFIQFKTKKKDFFIEYSFNHVHSLNEPVYCCSSCRKQPKRDTQRIEGDRVHLSKDLWYVSFHYRFLYSNISSLCSFSRYL